MRLHKYQIASRQFILDRYRRKSGSGLWLDCGLGKTIVTLSAIETLKEFGEVSRTIIVAPSRVIATSWPKEIRNWGLDLSWAWLTGDQSQREEALASNPDILFINCENLPKRILSEKAASRRKFPQLAEWIENIKLSADLLVVDESTKFKTWRSSRTNTLKRMLRRIPNRITLTGTPTPNNMGEIFPQQYLLDEGETLSPYIGQFRDKYMRNCGFDNREWEMRPEAIQDLQEKIAPWYLCQSAVDHLEMPTLVKNEIAVPLPGPARKIYSGMHQQMASEINNQEMLVALSGGAKYNMCRQIASGCVYNEEGDTRHIHTAKLEALESLFEELNGKSLLVAYWYKHEGEVLRKRFPKAAVIRSGTTGADTVSIIEKWKNKSINMILAQASAISHGIDGLQHGGNDLCWYTLTDNPDIRNQLEWRLYRQGVVGQVRIHYLLAESTVDRTIYRALNMKNATQQSVIQAVKELGNG